MIGASLPTAGPAPEASKESLDGVASMLSSLSLLSRPSQMLEAASVAKPFLFFSFFLPPKKPFFFFFLVGVSVKETLLLSPLLSNSHCVSITSGDVAWSVGAAMQTLSFFRFRNIISWLRTLAATSASDPVMASRRAASNPESRRLARCFRATIIVISPEACAKKQEQRMARSG